MATQIISIHSGMLKIIPFKRPFNMDDVRLSNFIETPFIINVVTYAYLYYW